MNLFKVASKDKRYKAAKAAAKKAEAKQKKAWKEAIKKTRVKLKAKK